MKQQGITTDILLKIFRANDKPLTFNQLVNALTLLGVNRNYCSLYTFRIALAGKLGRLLKRKIIRTVDGEVYHSNKRGRPSRLYCLSSVNRERDVLLERAFERLVERVSFC